MSSSFGLCDLVILDGCTICKHLLRQEQTTEFNLHVEIVLSLAKGVEGRTFMKLLQQLHIGGTLLELLV